ncbi:hypothetical protein ACHWQZ_G010852 [Mnemiopsis leidyi]
MLHLLLAVFVGAAAADDGWIAVERDVKINYDLENSPLQIKTDSVVGSGEFVKLWSYTQNDYTGGVYLYFSSPPQYYLDFCSTSNTNFPTVLPTETNKVWTITLSRVSGEIRVVITCNTVEVLNVVLSSTTCSDSRWSFLWNRDVVKIDFASYDTASDYYRAAPECTGLKTEWTSTIETTTQFPVLPGTVVTVTCSNSDAVNGGSSEVTCTKETDFTFSIEPSCLVSCEGLPESWRNMKTEPQFPLPPGSEVSLKCRTGYTLSGDNTVTCQEGRTFSFTTAPVCQLDKYREPPDIWSIKTDTPVDHGTDVELSCVTRYSVHVWRLDKRELYLPANASFPLIHKD